MTNTKTFELREYNSIDPRFAGRKSTVSRKELDASRIRPTF
jgi:hypothetical protein